MQLQRTSRNHGLRRWIFYPIIVRNGFRNTPDDHIAAEKLIQWLKQHGSPSLVTVAFKNCHKLPSILDDVWSWETVDDFLEVHGRTRLQLLQHALSIPRACQRSWLQAALQLLMRNQLGIQDLCTRLLRSMSLGMREDVPVIVLMARFGGEGKSFLLSLLRS